MDAIPTNSRLSQVRTKPATSASPESSCIPRDCANDAEGAAAAILGQLPTGIAIATRQGDISWCNPQFQGLLGGDASLANEVNLQGLLPADTWSALADAWNAIASGRQMSFAFRLADSAYRSLLLTAAPLQGHDGLLLRVDDVTGQDIAAQMMGATTRRNNQLFGKLRHALRNQLASINTAVEVIRLQHGESTGTAEMCDVIERQVERIAGQTNDLRDGNPATATQVTLQRQRLDLKALVLEVCHGQQAHLPYELQVASTDEDVLIEGDGPLLSQAFANLLRALATADDPAVQVAVDLTGQCDVVELRLTIRRRQPSSPRAMAARSAEHHPHYEPPPFSNPLALLLLARLVELHNGELCSAEQSEHVGRIRFQLPLASVERATQSRVADVAQSDAGLRCCRVLLVEDNTDFAASLKRLLGVLGNEVEMTADGETALELAQSFQPDIVLCDLQLPGRLDGHAVAVALRDANVHAKLVAISGEALEGDAVPPDSPFDQVLAKPIGLDALKRLLQANVPDSSAHLEAQ